MKYSYCGQILTSMVSFGEPEELLAYGGGKTQLTK